MKKSATDQCMIGFCLRFCTLQVRQLYCCACQCFRKSYVFNITHWPSENRQLFCFLHSATHQCMVGFCLHFCTLQVQQLHCCACQCFRKSYVFNITHWPSENRQMFFSCTPWEHAASCLNFPTNCS